MGCTKLKRAAVTLLLLAIMPINTVTAQSLYDNWAAAPSIAVSTQTQYTARLLPEIHECGPLRTQSVIILTIGNNIYTYNGVPVLGSEAPFIDLVHGRTMVPIRLVAERLGANVRWIESTRTIIISKDDVHLTLPVNVPLPDGMGLPVSVGERTFVPVRYISQTFGANVIWDDFTQSVAIISYNYVCVCIPQAAYEETNNITTTQDRIYPSTGPSVGTWAAIIIEGDATFKINTQAALDFIRNYDLETFKMVARYIGVIRQGSSSGMWAWLDPPTFVVGRATSDSSTIWYAGTIVHDAVHSKQYHQHLAIYGHVPYEVWTGMDAEMEALDIQISFLRRVGAPESYISWLESLIGVSWWDDYVWW